MTYYYVVTLFEDGLGIKTVLCKRATLAATIEHIKRNVDFVFTHNGLESGGTDVYTYYHYYPDENVISCIDYIYVKQVDEVFL